MRPGITQFPVDVLINLPVPALAGSFLVADSVGSYAYILLGQTDFYRINLNGSPAWQRLSDPPSGAGGMVFGAGVCAVWDEQMQRIWVVAPGQGGADFVWTGYYDVATGGWTSADAGGSLDLLLAATWSTDGALVDTYIAGTLNQYLYLRGSNLNTFYRFDKIGDAWAAMAVPTVASGAGVTLIYRPGFNPDFIYSTHGGGSTAMRRYTISTNTWANYIPVPMLTWVGGVNTGTCACSNPDLVGGFWRLNATGQIYAESRAVQMYPLVRIYGPDGVATVGNKLSAYKTGGVTFILVLLHSSTQIQRIRVVE